MEQIQRKENELNEIKQNTVIEHNEILEATRQEIMEKANTKHDSIMGEKKLKYNILNKNIESLRINIMN